MKKTVVLLGLVIAIASCGNNENKPASDATNNDAAAPAATADVSESPEYQKGLALVGSSDCFGCHKVSEKMTGPAYVDVAKRYAGKPGIEDSLANKIIHGGAGNWGQVAMTPHQNLAHDSAVAMVKYILLLNNQ